MLLKQLRQFDFQRVKAVLNTDKGVVAINGVPGDIQYSTYDHIAQTFLIEAIDHHTVDEHDLRTLLTNAQLGERH